MPNIAVLLATYNGEKHLEEQLDSLSSQTYQDFTLLARDDNSSDTTLQLLQTKKDIQIIVAKENCGIKKSFDELLHYALKESNTNYFMFCDQDDVWHKNKIEKTLLKMEQLEAEYPDIPLLIHTDLEVVNETLLLKNSSFMYYQNLNAKNNQLNKLLVQNTVTGCTVMVNRKLAELALPFPNESIMHDWWLGLVASKFGKIAYVDEATIKYRQHSKNSIGAKGFTLSYVVTKVNQVQTLSKNILQAKTFLFRYKKKLDTHTIEMLEDFISIESQSFWKRRETLFKHKIFKQGFIRNLGLVLKV